MSKSVPIARSELERRVEEPAAELRLLNDELRAEIAERKRAEEKYRGLASIVESTDDAVFSRTLEGIITSWNKGAEQMFGFQAEEVIGRHISLITPDDRIDEIKMDSGQPGDPRRLETERLRKDGARIDVALTVSAIRDAGDRIVGCSVIARDITERKRAEEQLLLTKYSLDHVGDSAVMMAVDGRFVFVNEACCEALGYTREELLERYVYDIDPNFSKESWADHWNNLRTLKSMTVESTHRNKDGHVFPVELSLSFLEYKGQEYGFAMVRDISERKQKDAALHSLTTRLLQLQDEERRRIARDLHDVTAQDLGAVVVNLAHLRRLVTDLKPDAQNIVTESLSLAEQVLQQIRTLAYLLHPPLLDQAGLASAMRWYIEGFTKRSGISVEMEVGPEIGRLTSEIETALFRIMQESLTNIHRHSGSGGATVRLIRHEESVGLYVKDQGSGMLDEASGETIESVQSLGVGILGMRQRLRQFGGKLEIETSRHGTEIKATVPVAGQ